MHHRKIMFIAILAHHLFLSQLSARTDATSREVISLNGMWEIAEGDMDKVPSRYDQTVSVPGLVDMASPGFPEVGTKSAHRQFFWYRRTFMVGEELPQRAFLKIRKAKYGVKVFLNGIAIGESFHCFTPITIDLADRLRAAPEQNELVIRVGADLESLPETVASGRDPEKIAYIPGIYDEVELILTGDPYVANVQVVPDIEGKTARVVAEVAAIRKADPVDLNCTVREVTTGRIVGMARRSVNSPRGTSQILDVNVPIANCQLWSPETPFLYELVVSTGSDAVSHRFGMRSFRFDRVSGKAILNGKPYMMRGTNVCIFRFFEDPVRGDLPWRQDWVRKLHRQFKGMHWNAIRYCIGFPPEKWYQIADEEGFLIQDEFPIWFGEKDWPPDLKAEHLAEEYAAWMRERCNHPCVVIWDAQNETITRETGKTIDRVRSLDLSNRPWENGWTRPAGPDDVFECHPYYFSQYRHYSKTVTQPLQKLPQCQYPQNNFATKPFIMAGLGTDPLFLRCAHENYCSIINEYAWLWLNRDGSPCKLTRQIYDNILGPEATVIQRRQYYARSLAALTEFWRCQRRAAGVLHFCGLGYSRHDGFTSDNFIDVRNLVFEPHFVTYVRDAFAPVGIMIDEWDPVLARDQPHAFRIIVINDLCVAWDGRISFSISDGSTPAYQRQSHATVPSLGRQEITFVAEVPHAPGRYLLKAELQGQGLEGVASLRDMIVCEASPQ